MKDWILLDNQLDCDVFCNPRLLSIIQKVLQTKTITLNGGKLTTNLIGNLYDYGDVWFSPNAITNIISLSNLKQSCRVMYDRGSHDAFITSTKGKCDLIFEQSNNGLCFFNTKIQKQLTSTGVASNSRSA